MTNVSASHSSSSTEIDSLKHRVEDTEREKRDLVGVVSRLKEDAAQREGESRHYNTRRVFITLNDRGDPNTTVQP